MGKKKLSASQKLIKLQDKKKKDAERKDILLGLQQGLEKSNESHMLDKMASIKNMSIQIREDRRAMKDVKYAQKQAKIGKQEQMDIDEEFESDDDGSSSEPDLEKKLKTDNAETKKKSDSGVNIFAVTEYVNANKQTVEELAEEDAVYQAKLQKIRDAQNSQAKLESEAKRLIPGLSLETFDGAKTTRRVMEELSTTDAQRELKAKEQEEFYKEIEHDDFIEDELIREIIQGQQKVQNYVNRTEQQQTARSKLPIIMREADILEAVDNNLITLLCGETGSGKSTQTVQFLYEAGYTNKSGPNPGMIGVTQPRRIAAIALAKRVADEMGMILGKEVVYQVRHEHSSFNEDSAIKFMTDGILMNEMCSDFLLRKYSVIVIDEAHERKINTDLLLGLLSRLVNIRARLALEERRNSPKDQTAFKYYPLRVIIMSATLRVEDFTGNKYLLPKKVNVINVEARQYPVNIYFSKRTPDDYLQAAVKKCAKIHAELPPGDVLVFLTGEREIKEFCISLGSVLGRKQKILEQRGQHDREYQQKDFHLEDSDGEEKDQEDDDDEADADDKLDEEEKNDSNGFLLGARRKLKLQAEEGQVLNKDSEVPDETENLGIITHNPIESENLKGAKKSFLKFKILPLYSKLPLQEQEKIFKDKIPGTRLIIAATNVAETSLTIPNIKYVVDTGREKKKVYSTKVAISQHIIKWISQASGDQRSGRAGRTSPGYCYRLYAPSVFANIFQPFSDPEILHMPLESVVLHLKAIGIQDVIKFPYPTPPAIANLRRAIQNLVKIKALQDKEVDLDIDIQDEEIDKTDDKSEITELGRVLAFLPINPRYAKMLLQGRAAGVSVYALLLVTALTVEEIFNRSDFKIFESDEPHRNSNLKEHEELYASDEDFKVKAKDLLKQKMNQIQEEREMKKKALEKRREEIGKFKEYFEKFMIGKSDLFIHINIIGEFVEKIYTDKPSTSQLEDYILKYATSQHLLPKSLKEIYNNLNQITDILDSILVSDEERKAIKQGFSPYVKPNEEQQKFLVEIIVACFIDQCARKINYLDEEGRKKVAYESLESNDRVLISQTSFLIKDQPDYVVYSEILDGRKKYMNNITIVTDIGLLHKYDYRTTNRKTQYVYEPKPSFSRKKDQLMVLAKSTFSKRKWDIPIFETVFSEESLEKYCWFAKSLLEGQVFDFFKACKSAYQYDLNLIKSSNLQPKVQAIVNRLKLNQLDSAKKLKLKWAQDQSFLLPEFLLWIKDTIKPAIQKKWPPSA